MVTGDDLTTNSKNDSTSSRYVRQKDYTPELILKKNTLATKKIEKRLKHTLAKTYTAGVEDVIALIETLKNQVTGVDELLEVLIGEAEGIRLSDLFEDKELFQMSERING